jgi:hypothetical protein
VRRRHQQPGDPGQDDERRGRPYEGLHQ